MDHGFKDRVDKVFGSISSSSSSSSSWSLTDAPVERRSWNRDKGGGSGSGRDDDETLVSSDLLNRQTNWDIRSSIGLDPTLDNEEEEDAYDKMAQARENGDGVYRKDLNVLPASASASVEKDKDARPMLNAIKSILKRKTDDDVAKGKGKRVRFHPTCKKKNDDVQPQPQGSRPGVPDYILNPSNYTRYDLSHVHQGSNTEAYMTLRNSSKPKPDDDVLPQSLVFIPRNKTRDVVCKQSSSTTSTSTSTGIGIAISNSALELEVGEISHDMQQQDEESHTTKPRPARRYRSKMDQDHHNVS